ncbi:MAG: glycosyltransferase [Bacilli bacterium]|uniref:glycosyltransferase family 2 protein n=1 Tax=Anaerorhabdus sp. TaxID=1872524 RepID=UPI002FCC3F49
MITIIIPIYNGEKHIERCLDSLLIQKNKNFELIIVNDGSTDKTLNILDKYIGKFENIRIITKENEGQGVARNIGIRESKGNYLVFLDGDDEVEPNYISEFYEVIKNQNIDLGISQIRRKFDYKPTLLESKFKYIQNVNTSEEISIEQDYSLITKILIAPFAKVIRKDFLLNNRIEFPANRIYEDLLFTISMLLANPSIIFIDKQTYSYHVRKENTMNSFNVKVTDMISTLELINKYANDINVYDKYKCELEFLAIYHLLIGSIYREWKYKPTNILKTRKICKDWFCDKGYSTNNKYLKNMKTYCRLYIYLFFHLF